VADQFDRTYSVLRLLTGLDVNEIIIRSVRSAASALFRVIAIDA
jgi:hypothetical protein